MPIPVRPNATAASGNSISIAACMLRILLPQTAKSPWRASKKERDRIDAQMNNRGSAPRDFEAVGAAPPTRQISR
jgi:hypothetical protein